MRSDRFLFLDFDGVLNSTGWAIRTEQRGIWGVDPDTIPHLQRIVDTTGCEVVLSSQKRLSYALSDIRGMIIKAGGRHPFPLVDKTPVLDRRSPGGIHIAPIRGDEIRAYLDAIRHTGPYVCLDDGSDYHPDQPLVRTDMAVGLTAAEADRCIEILGVKELANAG